ncbi:MAG: hypothetical protein J7M27_13640 [Candidatus Latescibacteria bacterium]|nr:hypothetical protein [Candidatus Latescibacterota bacterium]
MRNQAEERLDKDIAKLAKLIKTGRGSRGRGPFLWTASTSWATIKRVVSNHTYSSIILPTTSGTVIHMADSVQ